MSHQKVRQLCIVLILTMFLLTGCGKVETLNDPQILLCSIQGDDLDGNLLAQDRSIYQDYYKSISEYKAVDLKDFYNFIQNKSFDILHLFVAIQPDGTIDGQPASEVLKKLAERNVKLIIFARGTSAETFGKAFQVSKTESINVNFIVTLDRKGENFDHFFRDLFASMAKGETFLNAWAKLAPQAQDAEVQNLPSTVAVPNRGDLKIVP